MNGKIFYPVLVVFAAGYVLWTLAAHFAVDPQTSDFLSHKTNLLHPIRLPAWLRVLDFHVASACLAMAAGALNFSERLRRRNRQLHRGTGYVYIAAVLAVCATSGYMAPHATGGRAVSSAFNLLNLVWMAFTVIALVQIKRKRIAKHREWMIRSYLFCFTNLSIHALLSVFHGMIGMTYETGYAISVFGSIALLPLLAEAVIRLRPALPPSVSDRSLS
ncbi:DUF2306 domain-containing protein [Cohnella zeiphila]|uniref:DUF2306 domain-containing protein n=1 Tax=Cohnella zeiphila TaxID=2761120 RepID=A0A7X0STE7_9BACL|nr:DUF2306 domain-containing protein [Cohnella zeiphila]MBB6734565.1 DUF2306 domain-containing protein [Cohnella zeiphila]